MTVDSALHTFSTPSRNQKSVKGLKTDAAIFGTKQPKNCGSPAKVQHVTRMKVSTALCRSSMQKVRIVHIPRTILPTMAFVGSVIGLIIIYLNVAAVKITAKSPARGRRLARCKKG